MTYRFLNSQASFKERIIDYYADNPRFKEALFNDFELDLNQEVLKRGHEFIESLKGQRVLIIGDFDCDGISATAIIKMLFDKLGIANNYYIPSRFHEGYGLSLKQVQKAIDFSFDALVTVDNGITAAEALKVAKDKGIKTMVIDHHSYDTLPQADYILHGDLLAKPYQKACAAGLCYLLMASFEDDDLAACYAGVATFADMVEVFGYNRYLIKRAYQLLNKSEIKTYNALSGKKQNYTYDDLSFLLASRINAVSRIKGANVNTVVSFLLEKDDDKLLKGAQKLKQINNLRKDLSDVMTQRALRLVDDRDFLILYDEHFEEGLCGPVANRIARTFQKPCIVLAKGEEEIKGSGRSIDDFDLLTYLKKYDHLFKRLGGHKQAVGLSLDFDMVNPLLEATKVLDLPVSLKELPCLPLYAEDISLDTLAFINELEPFGIGFEEPLFYMDDLKISSRYLIKQKYTKFRFVNGLEAISFHEDDYNRDFKRLIAYLKADSYHKNRLSLQIQDLI